jgi:RNA polymerase sigma-70 factor (ECF subfamily)
VGNRAKTHKETGAALIFPALRLPEQRVSAVGLALRPTRTLGAVSGDTGRVAEATAFDLECLERAQAGDRDAIALLYRAFAPVVIGYLRGAGSADPEDLCGDVFVAMVKQLPSFEGDETAFRRWLFSIAHHRLIDERRRRATRQRVEDVISLRDDEFGHDAYEGVVARLDAIGVVDALDVLTDDQRSVVLLRTMAELSVADTAEILGKREGAVKTLHRRALATLRRTLEAAP